MQPQLAVRHRTDALQGDNGLGNPQSPRPGTVGAGELVDGVVRQRGVKPAANQSITQQACRRGQGMVRFVFAGAAMALLCATACARTPMPEAGPVTAEPAETPMTEPQRQNLSAKLPAGQSITIDNPYGNVYLRFGGYEHEVGIHATMQQPAGAATIDLKVGKDNDRYLIAARLPAGATLAQTQRLDLVVYVPEQHAVSVRTEQGDIESRGVKSDLDLKSVAGNIAARGTEGTVQAETKEGAIEAAFAETAPPGSTQRLATTTGNIVLGVTDRLNARLRLATSDVFATEYSLDVKRHPGQEPNKHADAVIGTANAEIILESRRGEIRLMRRAEYLPVEEAPPTPPPRG